MTAWNASVGAREAAQASKQLQRPLPDQVIRPYEGGDVGARDAFA
jgi:hypothetical protein